MLQEQNVWLWEPRQILETLQPIHIDTLANVFAQRKRSLVLDAILKGELERALHELSRTGPEASEQLLTRLRSGEVIGYSDKDCGTLNKKGFVPF
jgi:lauroyl/myristoyl acyltransferase